MSSPVNWGARPSKKAQSVSSSAALDAFVHPEHSKATKRLNLNLPAKLHARMKAQCALAGRDMTEVLIELFEERFPESK